LAIKSLVSFFDWGMGFISKLFNKEHNKLTEKEEIKKRLQHEDELITALKNNQ